MITIGELRKAIDGLPDSGELFVDINGSQFGVYATGIRPYAKEDLLLSVELDQEEDDE